MFFEKWVDQPSSRDLTGHYLQDSDSEKEAITPIVIRDRKGERRLRFRVSNQKDTVGLRERERRRIRIRDDPVRGDINGLGLKCIEEIDAEKESKAVPLGRIGIKIAFHRCRRRDRQFLIAVRAGSRLSSFGSVTASRHRDLFRNLGAEAETKRRNRHLEADHQKDGDG